MAIETGDWVTYTGSPYRAAVNGRMLRAGTKGKVLGIIRPARTFALVKWNGHTWPIARQLEDLEKVT